MNRINEIFRTYAPEYIERFADSIPKMHRKAIDAIINCRTPRYGLIVYDCDNCGQPHLVSRSCGNRHCPACQNHKTMQWVETQMKRRVQGQYFMITFTVPEQLRAFIRSNQRIAYGAMFRASAHALKKLATDEKHIGGDFPGFFGVLHTWGRQLQYHPHIHYVAPGGAVSKKDGTWHPSRTDFYLPVHAISKIYKAKFRDEMKKAGLYSSINAAVWQQAWNVNCEPAGSGEQSIKYLSRYVFKVAISNSRIIKVENRNVFVRFRKSGSKRYRVLVLDVMEFLRRFLQHVLPTGFMKIRHYGFLSPCSSVPLEKVRSMIKKALGLIIIVKKTKVEPAAPIYCSKCGGTQRFRYLVLPFEMAPVGPG